ncbi:MAG: glutamate-1-semialdehyde 2,1-aminomutase, partial [Holdemanella sp.]|nr:glutamate-1-semialdehyde 2,1-aminomutase [Holdemanella sp.]
IIKKDKIIKFKGCYHGHMDALLVKAGSAALTTSVPDSQGVPYDVTKDTLVANYNDLDSVQALFDANKDEIACVIVEPVAANMGVVLPKEGFLEGLRKITEENHALLIFDEVITGFRLGLSGAQGYYNIKPDLTTLGKIVGGGMPIGAYGGKKEIMDMVSPVGPVYQAGTLSGNPIATTAGLATLNILKNYPEIYIKLEKNTKHMADEIRKLSNGKVCVNQIASLMCIYFTETPVENYEQATSSDTKKYADYFSYMLQKGIYLAPSQFEAMFISDALSDEDIEKTLQAIKDYFNEMRD